MAECYEHPTTTVTVQSLINQRHAQRDGVLQTPQDVGQWTGTVRGLRRGQGGDFDDLRHYTPGDDLRHVDWNASARTNTLHTRLYREEREHRVTLITDIRRTLYTGTQCLRSVRACHLTARLLWQAIDRGSRTGVVVIRDAGINVSEYGSGHHTAINACALISQCFQHPSDTPPISLPPLHSSERHNHVHLDAVAQWLLARRTAMGTVIWLSAFDQLGDQFNQTMKALSQPNRQVAIHISDSMLTQGLPPGRYGYRYGSGPHRTNRVITLDRKKARQLHQTLQQQEADRVERFSTLRIPLLNSDTDSSDIVMRLRQLGYLQ